MNMEQQRKSFEDWVLKHPDYRALTNYEESIMFDAWLAAHQQEGYAMVPVEPTQEMLRAGEISHAGYDNIDAKEVYKAMIQAEQE